MSRHLISKLPTYLVRLQLIYQNAGESRLSEIVLHCNYATIEDAAYDNWNGGMYGHDVVLFLPIQTLSLVGLAELQEVCKRLLTDLNTLGEGIENESFNALRLDLNDDNDPKYQRAVPFSKKLPVNPDAVEFWKPGLARVFVSHRDAYKKEARELGEALEEYGLSCFIAHDTIAPLAEWRGEIMKGLETMEAMIVFMTDDFQDSLWCQQEVGYALGRSAPIVPLKLGSKDPPGFISHVQAMRGNIDDPLAAAKGLFPLIGKALGRQERLNEVLITAFCDSPSYSDTKERFDRMKASVKSLTDAQLQQIVAAFAENGQLSGAGYLTGKYERLRCFLEAVTHRKFTVAHRIISEQKQATAFADDDADVPF
ncbi:toll/interleukin-1 receptor domain-containing protein [Sphingomonas sp. PB4P5]|uniref:toll/interleukin-1 receptor domain-containing protein n=1 Tax=Parasphingomonas puruogangriensis TaxID=3096155 RepID=UPI002FC84907